VDGLFQTLRRIAKRSGIRTNAAHLLRKEEVLRSYYSGKNLVETKKCIMPFISFYVSVEGEIRPCCRFSAKHVDMGTFNGARIGEVINNEKFVHFRKCLKENKAPDTMCINCFPDSIYETMAAKFLKR
jgi:radical SAM protein with 4Fe4S-binding SPASM domain